MLILHLHDTAYPILYLQCSTMIAFYDGVITQLTLDALEAKRLKNFISKPHPSAFWATRSEGRALAFRQRTAEDGGEQQQGWVKNSCRPLWLSTSQTECLMISIMSCVWALGSMIGGLVT
jgi:hypothetical protein